MMLRSQAFAILAMSLLVLSPAFAETPLDDLIKPELNKIFTKLTTEPQPKHALRVRTKLDEDLFDSALEKLWIHGGVLVAPDETVRRGNDSWAPSYEAQVAHRLVQSEQMADFAESHGCRMVHLVQHFGDEDDVHPTRPQAYNILRGTGWQRLNEYLDPEAMGVPLEVRNPYLDIRVVRYLLRVPPMPWFAEKELLRRAMIGKLPGSRSPDPCAEPGWRA